MYGRIWAFIAVLAAVHAATAAGTEPAELPWQRLERSELHMGTAFQIAVYAQDAELAERALEAAFARIAALDDVMSDYDPQSELSRLSSASPTLQPVPLSDDLFRVLSAAQHVSRTTDGAFDVTVGPLSRLWRRARRQQEMPPQNRLHDALEAVGYQYLKLDPQSRTASLARRGMRLDLGGIAKGFAVDEALSVLFEHGLTRALVNGGGDLAVGDPPPNRDTWQVGIAPLDSRKQEMRQVELVRAAVATSGDTWQYVELDGKRYSHLLDPRTGLGITRRSSVTVIAPSCTTADAYASALSVLGPEAGLKVIAQVKGAAALIAWQEGGMLYQRSSPGFPRLSSAGLPDVP